MKPLICRHCGQEEHEHHAFEPIKIPEGCKCDWDDWGDPINIPPVCDEWTEGPYSDPSLCGNCEHPRECHKERAA